MTSIDRWLIGKKIDKQKRDIQAVRQTDWQVNVMCKYIIVSNCSLYKKIIKNYLKSKMLCLQQSTISSEPNCSQGSITDLCLSGFTLGCPPKCPGTPLSPSAFSTTSFFKTPPGPAQFDFSISRAESGPFNRSLYIPVPTFPSVKDSLFRGSEKEFLSRFQIWRSVRQWSAVGCVKAKVS